LPFDKRKGHCELVFTPFYMCIVLLASIAVLLALFQRRASEVLPFGKKEQELFLSGRALMEPKPFGLPVLGSRQTLSKPDGFVLGASRRGPEIERFFLTSSLNEGQTDGSSLSVRRYRKGIELIRLLYEKSLALEYHFSALRLNERVEELSNPMNFPAFRESLAVLTSGKGRHVPDLPGVLMESPEGASLYFMLAAMSGKSDPELRQKELDRMGCLLRLLIEMQMDLKSIYYENHLLYLRTTELRQRCERLFSDYTRVVGYHKSLQDCRTEDDWDALDDLIKSLSRQIKEGENTSDPALKERVYTDLINMEFSVDRLLDYLDFYDEVLTSGRHMYRESQLILRHLTEVESCSSQIPGQLLRLQKDIDEAVERFDKAYEMVEVKGSRLKDLLYGFDQLEKQ